MKIDSGPGRMNKSMLTHVQSCGFCLCPGCPNTTQATQEMDQNHGPFEACHCHNMDALCKHRLFLDHANDECNTVNMSDMWLLIWGESLPTFDAGPGSTVPGEQLSHGCDSSNMSGHTIPAVLCGNQCKVLFDVEPTEDEFLHGGWTVIMFDSLKLLGLLCSRISILTFS